MYLQSHVTMECSLITAKNAGKPTVHLYTVSLLKTQQNKCYLTLIDSKI